MTHSHSSTLRRSSNPSTLARKLSKVQRLCCLVLLAGLLANLSAGCSAVSNLFPAPATAEPAPVNQPAPTPLPGLPAATPLPPPAETEVTFQVTVPAGTPPDDTIYLSLRDEVTGLAINAEHYPMQVVEDSPASARVYTLTLPFAIGSAVQYRYERQAGGVTVAEHVSDGTPVRYRLYHVVAPGAVSDVVSRWTNTQFNATTGRIIGRATDAETEQPIPSLLVTAGGAQTLTHSDGTFLLEGLPPGVHNLVAYALDGSYRTFQQGAQVAADSTTPAALRMVKAPLVSVTFVVRLPAETPPIVPVRLAGNLYSLGNTFASLAGGISSLATNMPVLSPLPDGRYNLTLSLPAGADIRYKYTLGDGFWNAEHTADGAFRLRQLIIPNGSVLVEDEVETWRSGSQGSLTFDVTTPPGTPPDESLSIQFNPVFGWTEPLPMWSLGPNRWAYVLYSPLNLPGSLHYRYCRNGQCGLTDDAVTAGDEAAGRLAEIGPEPQMFKDQVESWAWLPPEPLPAAVAAEGVQPRGPGYMAGVEFIPAYHPSWRARLPNSLGAVQSLGANWVVVSPTWTYTRQSPPVLEPVAGQDATWFDLVQSLELTNIGSLQAAVNPTPHFLMPVDQWWQEAERDFSWWLVWFEHYRAFAIHHADLAALGGAEALVLGGSWLTPALPAGELPGGGPSGVPADSDARWRSLIAEVRSHYTGKIWWALPYEEIENAPPFLDAVDSIYLLWSAPLTSQGEDQAAMEAEAGRLLDTAVRPIQLMFEKPLILAVAYPAADGGITGCVPQANGGCLAPAGLLPNAHDDPAVRLDLAEQASVYAALLSAANQRDWIAGFVSRGYYPPAVLLDKSTSVHGKPAGMVLTDWFPRLLANP